MFFLKSIRRNCRKFRIYFYFCVPFLYCKKMCCWFYTEIECFIQIFSFSLYIVNEIYFKPVILLILFRFVRFLNTFLFLTLGLASRSGEKYEPDDRPKGVYHEICWGRENLHVKNPPWIDCRKGTCWACSSVFSFIVFDFVHCLGTIVFDWYVLFVVLFLLLPLLLL